LTEAVKKSLEELESEEKWDRAFIVSGDILGKLVDEALNEHKKGKTKPLILKEL
jgi:hypothetical protein